MNLLTLQRDNSPAELFRYLTDLKNMRANQQLAQSRANKMIAVLEARGYDPITIRRAATEAHAAAQRDADRLAHAIDDLVIPETIAVR